MIATTAAQDRLVVALTRVAPAALVDAGERERQYGSDEDPPDRAFQQDLVAVLCPCTVLEPQLEGEVVREHDQEPVHGQLGHRASVEG